MSANIRYWIWLAEALGYGASFKEIIQEYGSAERLYNANILEWRMSPVITAKQIEGLARTDISVADKIISQCDENNWDIIDFEDERYPERLKEIHNPPAVLYVDGTLPDIDNTAVIGVVGARKASRYAVKATRLMSNGLAQAGALIVSGAALGVDSAAHMGAIDACKQTVGVLGCGFGSGYLLSNEELRNMISHAGALITEYPPYTKASKTTFPMRNRIISGLSVGVLVTEAGVKSGSLITATLALQEGKDVFAIPSSILDVNFLGTNKLIDDGAYVATSPYSVVNVYSDRFSSLDITKAKSVAELAEEARKNSESANAENEADALTFDSISQGRRERVRNQELSAGLTGDERKVYFALDDTLMNIDSIITKSELDSSRVAVALTKLEVKGLVSSASGRRYKQS